MSYLTFNRLQEASVNKYKNCLPLQISYIPKGYRLVCMNTHVYNVCAQTSSTLITAAMIQFALKQTLKGFLPLSLLLTGISLSPLIEQYDARDFVLIKGSDPDYFDVSDALMQCPVLAINDGTVISAVNNTRNDAAPGNMSLGPAGNHIVIEHDGFYSLYAHLFYNSIKVKKGDKVNKGQKIAELGNTGNSSAPHLHFEFTRTDPTKFGIGKSLDNFEDYKYTSIPWKDMILSGMKVFKEYYNKPLVMNKTGELDSLCYLN